MSEEQYFQAVYKGITDYCRSTNNAFISPSRSQVNEDYYARVSVQSCVRKYIEEWYGNG